VLYNISGLSCIAEHDGFDKKKKKTTLMAV